MDSLQSRRRRFSNSSQVVEDSSAFLKECWSGKLTSKIDHGLWSFLSSHSLLCIEFENNSLKKNGIWHGLRCQVTKSRLFFWDLPNFRAHNSLFVFFKISFPPGSTFIIRYRIIMNYLCNSLSICDMICLVIIPCFFFPSNRLGSLRWSEVPFPNGWWWSLWDGWRLGFLLVPDLQGLGWGNGSLCFQVRASCWACCNQQQNYIEHIVEFAGS